MLDDIDELRTFVSVVAARSLSAAGREMDLVLSVVSKRLAALERRTGIRLIARNTAAEREYRHRRRRSNERHLP